jgi:rhamnosyltransferase subunit B
VAAQLGSIVIATLGSLGDLHPFIAIARELRRRGHAPIIATLACYRRAVEDSGITFHAVRPPIGMDDPSLMRSIVASPRGLEALVGEHLLPHLHESFEDLYGCARGAAGMIVGSLSYAAPAAAAARGVPWCWAILSPIFTSIGRHPAPASVRESWSPRGVLALFSPVLARPQADWPARTTVTGFPFYDGPPTVAASELERFLNAGDPPLVFTLGSAAVFEPGAFFEESLRAAQRLGRRAVLLTGANPPPSSMPDGALAIPYAPYSRLFPHAAAIVHQGGIGTVGQALRAGRPMLVVPRFLDQPDNAARIRQLGVGRVLHHSAYTAERVADELASLLGMSDYITRARALGAALRLEDGAASACDAFEREALAA